MGEIVKAAASQPLPCAAQVGDSLKRKRERLTLGQKLEVLRELEEAGATAAGVAGRRGVAARTVRRVAQQREELLKAQHEFAPDTRSVRSAPALATLEDMLAAFVRGARRASSVSPPSPANPELLLLDVKVLRTQALHIKDGLLLAPAHLPQDELAALAKFTASMAWLRKFARRYDFELARDAVADQAARLFQMHTAADVDCEPEEPGAPVVHP